MAFIQNFAKYGSDALVRFEGEGYCELSLSPQRSAAATSANRARAHLRTRALFARRDLPRY